MDAIECLKTRRSRRRYIAEPIAREVIEDIVDCGRLAPTARNDQPWEFVVVEDQATRDRLAELATYGKFLGQSPVCIAVLCRPEGGHGLEDGCAATTNIVNAARAHGLGTCWIAGWERVYSRDVVSLLGGNESLALVSLIALGKADILDDPHPPKRPLAEVLHWGSL